jgi:GntR family transcriptional regulator
MKNNLPIYSQLKEHIIRQIADGELRPGDQISSQHELCEQYQMSHMTVRRALNELLKEGILRSIPGKGTYVASPTRTADSGALITFSAQMSHLGMKPSTRVLSQQIIPGSTVLAQILGMEIGQPIVSLYRLRCADGQPLSLTQCYLPHELCPGLLDHDLAANSLFDTLRKVYHFNLAGASSVVQAALADEEQSRLLKIERPAALIVREQVTYLDSGRVIEFSRSFIIGDRYNIKFQEGVVPHNNSLS